MHQSICPRQLLRGQDAREKNTARTTEARAREQRQTPSSLTGLAPAPANSNPHTAERMNATESVCALVERERETAPWTLE